MLAIPIECATDFIRFEGPDTTYPEWFAELLDSCFDVEVGPEYVSYVTDQTIIHINFGDAFLRNPIGNIRRVDGDEFEELFDYTNIFGGGPMFCAFKSECLEFVRYEGIWYNHINEMKYREYPTWFQEYIDDGFIEQRENVGGPDVHLYYSQDGEIALSVSPGDVFICNKFGQIMFMTSERFNDEFYEVN